LSYDGKDYLADVGGYLGLLLGMSIFDFAGILTDFLFKRLNGKIRHI